MSPLGLEPWGSRLGGCGLGAGFEILLDEAGELGGGEVGRILVEGECRVASSSPLAAAIGIIALHHVALAAHGARHLLEAGDALGSRPFGGTLCRAAATAGRG